MNLYNMRPIVKLIEMFIDLMFYILFVLIFQVCIPAVNTRTHTKSLEEFAYSTMDTVGMIWWGK